ncbi:LamG domain-containing protein [candidate division KSB1 bacterium]|nr:LamG domain-containing protein [candidate division KSB1 bacterium]
MNARNNLAVQFFTFGLIAFFLQSHLIGAGLQLVGSSQDTMFYLPLNGDYNDYSGNGLQGTGHGDVKFEEGRFGKAVYFDGDNDFLSFPDAPSLRVGENFTISFWFKLAESFGAKQQNKEVHLLRMEKDKRLFSPSYAVQLRGQNDSLFIATWISHATGASISGLDVVIEPQKWYRFTLARDNKFTRNYIDDETGLPVGYNFGASYEPPYFQHSVLFIGGLSKEGRPERLLPRIADFHGWIDEIVILNNAIDLKHRFETAFDSLPLVQKKSSLDLLAMSLYNFKYLPETEESYGILKRVRSVDPSRIDFYSSWWRVRKKIEGFSEQFVQSVKNDIDVLLSYHSKDEAALATAMKGCMLIRDFQKLKILEDQSAELFPDGEIAHRRNMLQKNPQLTYILMDTLDVETRELYPDLVIGKSIDSVDVDTVDPHDVFFNFTNFSLDAEQNIYAFDRATFKISQFDSSGKFIRDYDGDDQFNDLMTRLAYSYMDVSNKLHAISVKRNKGNYWTLSPDGSYQSLGWHKALGEVVNINRHPQGFLSNSRYSVYRPIKKDVKGDELKNFKPEQGIVDLIELKISNNEKLHIKKVGSLGTHLTDGGTLEGRFDNFTLLTLNDVAYDFDKEGNIYLLHKYVPRFRKLSREGKLLFDYEFGLFTDKQARATLRINNFKLLFCFSAIKTTPDGYCLLIRGDMAYYTNPDGNILKIFKLREKSDSKFFYLNTNQNMSLAVDQSGTYLYGHSTEKIYRFKIN